MLGLLEGPEDPPGLRVIIPDEARIPIGPRHRFVAGPTDRDRHRHDERAGVLGPVQGRSNPANVVGVIAPDDPRDVHPPAGTALGIDDDHGRLRSLDERVELIAAQAGALGQVHGHEAQAGGESRHVLAPGRVVLRVEHHRQVQQHDASPRGRFSSRTIVR